MLVAGDFNSIPGSAAHSLLVKGRVEPQQLVRGEPAHAARRSYAGQLQLQLQGRQPAKAGTHQTAQQLPAANASCAQALSYASRCQPATVPLLARTSFYICLTQHITWHTVY